VHCEDTAHCGNRQDDIWEISNSHELFKSICRPQKHQYISSPKTTFLAHLTTKAHLVIPLPPWAGFTNTTLQRTTLELSFHVSLSCPMQPIFIVISALGDAKVSVALSLNGQR
jgi:hypothetical protein